MLKRITSMTVGIAILAFIFILDSFKLIEAPIFFNIALAVVSLMMTDEFYKAVEKKGTKPIKLLGYLMPIAIIPIGILKPETITLIYFLIFPVLIFACFVKSIRTNMKYNIIDIAVTVFAPLYTTFLASFLAHTRALKDVGVWYVWFIFGGAWFTDSFAFVVGKLCGKHKFSKISPNKSIEGCIGGLLGATAFYIIFTQILHNLQICELNYIVMGILGCIVSIISQIGDIAASSIKRYCGIKDFSNLMPGHGGMLDRFDSVLFIAPVVFLALSIML